MKIRTILFATWLTALSSFGQGALTPPGAPAPMMKTLSQVEPRIAITNSGAVTISQAGSYYLTTNIAVSSGHGVTITASQVTLDLNGFTISSTASPSGGYGVALAANGLSDINIFNGHIRGGVTNTGNGSYTGPGFQNGISYTGTTPSSTHVSDVSVSGCAGTGINLGGGFFANASVARDCMVKTMQSGGIAADVVSSCAAIDCGGTAIAGGVVTGCRGESTGTGFGVFGNVVENSQGTANTSDGVYGTMLHNCYGTSTNGIGIHALTSAEHCYGRSTGTAGVNAANALFCTGNRSGGTANQGFAATGCVAEAGTNNFTYKYNMP